MARTLDRAVKLAPNDIVTPLQRAAVDMNWRADSKPFHAAIDRTLNANPAAAHAIADHWIDLAVHERDAKAAERALGHLSPDGCHIGSIPFPRSWCEGLAARLRGDEEAARRAFTAARDEAAQIVRSHPDYSGALCVLGMAHAALGEKDAAIRAGLRATELEPISRNAVNGPLIVGYLAVIYAWTGEKELALDQLDALPPSQVSGATETSSCIHTGILSAIIRAFSRLSPHWRHKDNAGIEGCG
jgi:tetratricopeptide (TPR) repeat protein